MMIKDHRQDQKDVQTCNYVYATMFYSFPEDMQVEVDVDWREAILLP